MGKKRLRTPLPRSSLLLMQIVRSWIRSTSLGASALCPWALPHRRVRRTIDAKTILKIARSLLKASLIETTRNSLGTSSHNGALLSLSTASGIGVLLRLQPRRQLCGF